MGNLVEKAVDIMMLAASIAVAVLLVALVIWVVVQVVEDIDGDDGPVDAVEQIEEPAEDQGFTVTIDRLRRNGEVVYHREGWTEKTLPTDTLWCRVCPCCGQVENLN